jgi:putative aldouronate transport system substrate-binding protein
VKRNLSVLVLIAAVATLIPLNVAAQAKSADPVTITWYVEGDGQPADTDLVQAEINKILGPKLGVNLKLMCLPWGDYNNKMQVKLAAGEDFDLCFTSNWSFDFATNVAKGLYLSLDDLIAKYGKDYSSYVPQTIRNGAKVKGKTYGYVNYQLSYMYENKVVNAEWADAAKFNPLAVKRLEDYEPFLAWVIKNQPKAYPWAQGASEASDQVQFNQLYFGIEPLINVHTPGAISTSASGNPKVFNQYESPEYAAYYRLMRKWAQAGYLKPEQMSIDDLAALRTQGLLGVEGMNRWGPSFAAGGDGKTLERPIAQEGGIKVYRDPFPSNLNVKGPATWQNVKDSWKVPGTARPYLTTGAVQGTITAINSASKHPVEVAKFFNLLYSSDPDGVKVLELLKFGIEGTHYTIDPKDKNHIVELPRLKDGWLYGINWELGPGNIKGLCWKNENTLVHQTWTDLNASAPASPAMGFSVDTSKVSNQIAAVSSVINEYSVGLALGVFPDVDKTFGEFRAKMKAAGSDRIVAEIQSQLDAWKAASK